MRDHLKVYNVKLHVLTPVFIGNGREISKKEYLIDPINNKAVVYDPGEFYKVMSQKGAVKSYEDYLLNNRYDSLDQWMKKNRITSQDVKSALKYSVACGDRFKELKGNLQVMEFIKDPYGLPYVPGSSLKGMLRTILLCYEISKQKERYAEASDSIEKYKCNRISDKNYGKEAAKVENIAFRRCNRLETRPYDAVNDVLQGLIVSDSKPLKKSDLIWCQKIDYLGNNLDNSLNILRECIKPNIVVEFTITIDTDVCKYDDKKIIEAIACFDEMYDKEFLMKFNPKREKLAAGTVYLGGGVGFVSKTFIYSMFKGTRGVKVTSNVFRNTIKERIYIEHKHAEDERKGVSPHIIKCTKYNGKRYQMGKCRFEIIPM